MDKYHYLYIIAILFMFSIANAKDIPMNLTIKEPIYVGESLVSILSIPSNDWDKDIIITSWVFNLTDNVTIANTLQTMESSPSKVITIQKNITLSPSQYGLIVVLNNNETIYKKFTVLPPALDIGNVISKTYNNANDFKHNFISNPIYILLAVIAIIFVVVAFFIFL